MDFKLWSELNKEAKEDLKPDFGFRDWGKLSEDEKYKIWKYLEHHFFRRDIGRYEKEYEFYGDYNEKAQRKERILLAIYTLNDAYKARSYAKEYLEDHSLNNACVDFYSIFTQENENVVMELLSFYSKVAIVNGNWESIYKDEDETEEQYQERLEEWKWIPFDKFAEDVNEVFLQFNLNLNLTRMGFIPRQEEKIIKEVFDPVLKSLSHPRWKEVSRLLSDAFLEYRKNTPHGFSNCVTNTVAAVQAFLQLLVNGETGSGDISKLITQAQGKNLIPGDPFTKEIFSNVESILMRERQETGTAHPKKEYATDKNARLTLNLAMVFFQHVIQG